VAVGNGLGVGVREGKESVVDWAARAGAGREAEPGNNPTPAARTTKANPKKIRQLSFGVNIADIIRPQGNILQKN
jgi:hypothetical protein